MQYIMFLQKYVSICHCVCILYFTEDVCNGSLRWILVFVFVQQCTDVHMVSDSDGDDFEDATEFGVDDGEMFGVASSALRKSPMSKS